MAHADYRHQLEIDIEGRDFHDRIYNYLGNDRICIKMQVQDDLVVSLAIGKGGDVSILVHPEDDPHQFRKITSVTTDPDSQCVERADVYDLLNVLAEFTHHKLTLNPKLRKGKP